jgi:hypothetical protein
MVFDVEAVGLHGEGFAVGYVVIDTKTGEEVDSGIAIAHEDLSPGLPDDRDWIKKNVVPALETYVPRVRASKPVATMTAPDVRLFFWELWRFWRAQGAWLAADVAWPVEARFLAACVDESRGRAEKGPYPLIDIASVRFGAGLDPLAHEDRWPTELPAHNPLADARQSARLLLKALASGKTCEDGADDAR